MNQKTSTHYAWSHGYVAVTSVMLAVLVCIACQPQESRTESADALAGKDRSIALFTDVSQTAGMSFGYNPGATGRYYFPEIMGGGVALFDYDQDGDLDVYFTNGLILGKETSDKAVPDSNTSVSRGNRLFRNRLSTDNRLQFEDVSAVAGVSNPSGYGQGTATGDYDNDGDIDLYVTNFGANVFYQNNGNGTFTDITEQTGADDERWTTSASFLDYDRDGDLDLFMTNYVAFTEANNTPCHNQTGHRNYCAPSTFKAVPDRLFRNDGGHFTDVSSSANISSAFGAGLGVISADFNGDDWPDIYVANDGMPNQLWINNGDATFTDQALMSGSAVNASGHAEAGMGVTAADFDGDGDEDLFMTHLINETNTLYLNDGRANFRDVTNRFGLSSSSLQFTGFGTGWFDFDNDGDLDIFVANGGVTQEADLRGIDPFPFHQTNILYRNDNGNFVDISATAGEVMQLRETSRGVAFGDVDNDGDIDVVVANINGPARLLLNNVGSKKTWLRVRLKGTESPLDGSGARIAFFVPGRAPIWRRAHTDGSYLSASDSRVHIGLDTHQTIDGIGVHWPSGRREQWPAASTNSEILLVEGTGESWQ